MKISAVLLAVAAASCGGTDGGRDACEAYAKAMRAPLGRLERAADAFGGARLSTPDEGARASRELAARVAEIRAEVERVRATRADLRAANRELAGALDAMKGALELLAGVLAARDETRREEARVALKTASEGWVSAVKRVKAGCPGM